ncbi:hypothetical protein BY996DRAFT_8295396, partial [Phakopsora pachyrhizi]
MPIWVLTMRTRSLSMGLRSVPDPLYPLFFFFFFFFHSLGRFDWCLYCSVNCCTLRSDQMIILQGSEIEQSVQSHPLHHLIQHSSHLQSFGSIHLQRYQEV